VQIVCEAVRCSPSGGLLFSLAILALICLVVIVNQIELEDPRFGEGFRADLFPLCDGAPAPPADSEDRTDLRMLEFASVFYRINLCYDQLREAGAGTGPNPEIMVNLEAAAKARDALEDRLAPEGFYAEQELEGVITVNLVFRHALARFRPHEPIPQQSSSDFELEISLPPPPGVTLNQHLRNHFAELLGIDVGEGIELPPEAAEMADQIADQMGSPGSDDDDGA